MKTSSLIFCVFSLLMMSCQSYLVGPDNPSYYAIFSFGNELKQTHNLRIVGFGGGRNTFNITLMGSQTPDRDEARAIFYDVSMGFLEQINSNEQLRELIAYDLYTIANLNISIMFAEVENTVTTIGTGTTDDRKPEQFIYFFTYDPVKCESDITYKEPYEELKRFVEQQRGIIHSP